MKSAETTLEAWVKENGEKQMALYWTPEDDPSIKVLVLAWWSPDGTSWQTSATLEVVQELHERLMEDRYTSVRQQGGK